MRRFNTSLLPGFLLLLLACSALSAADRSYVLILQDEPASRAVTKGMRRDAPEIAAKRDSIRAKQQAVVSRAESLGFHVTGRLDTLLNAVFVKATDKDVPKLRAIPGVLSVSPMRRGRPLLNEAVGLVGAPNAWNGAFGGISSAGAGQKIAILDTGIDQTHPAFQGSSLAVPAGFPKCDTPANCAYTNNKVIVARSYVVYDAGTDPATDFPDDVTPDDRVGHGTGVAMAAGGRTAVGPLATITGLAPQAYLGNYKIYGSPGVNDEASEQAILQAFEDAFNDGMDVATLSSAVLPLAGPSDGGGDPLVQAIENSINGGMVVVLGAGNDGSTGIAYQTTSYPTLNTIAAPGDTPDAITVAATGNSRIFAQSVQLVGPNVPSNLTFVLSVSGVGVTLHSSFQAPLVDAAKFGDGFGCDAYPAGSMSGAIGLVERGSSSGTDCSFADLVSNVQTAGALGVIIYDNLGGESTEPLFPIQTTGTNIPAFFVANADGLSMKSYLDSTSGVQAILDPTLNSNRLPAPDESQVTYFSSHGPVTGTSALKPDVAAPGENIYTATQNTDPNGKLYDSSRYTLTSGTSFATPIVAGIAAMVRQKNPGFTALQVKSAIVDTSNPNATNDPYFTGLLYASPVTSVGGGLVRALAAVTTNVTVEPSSLSFGVFTQNAAVTSVAQAFTIANQSSASLTLALTISTYNANAGATLALDNATVTLAAGASQTVHLTLSGTAPVPGLYGGSVAITGGAATLQVPFLYLVGTGVANDLFAVAGNQDVGFTGQAQSQGFSAVKVVDAYGVAMAGTAVAWSAQGGGAVSNADPQTDSEGFARATFTLGPTANQTYSYTATVSGLTPFTFQETAIAQPVISAGGVVNAASFTLGQGIAPGSLVAVFGTGLAVDASPAAYTPLPISMTPTTNGLPTSVGFDASGVSVPAPLLYISPGQVNIQVPWELAGQTTAQMKVNIEPMNGALITVPIATYSPSCFTANGNVIAQNLPSYSLVSSSAPAVPGAYVILYCNGLGPVNHTPASGSPATDATSTTTTLPAITIGGQSATVLFSGLTPGLVGVYQLNVQIPAGVGAGNQPLVLSIGGVDAPTLNIPVQ